MLIGIENQPDPFINNYPLDALGYRVEHFACLLKDTNEKIQLTIDSGHRNLSTEITVTNLINFAKNTEKQIINFHFHENKGIVPAVTAAGGSCDGHELAIPEHIHGFTNYLVRSVFENIPLNLEIKTRNYSPIKLFQYISGLHQTLHYIYNEIKKQQSL